MKGLADQMAKYAAYHRTPGNKAIHFVFVPLIVWSLMGLLGITIQQPYTSLEVSFAMVLSAVVLLYYLMLDYALGVAMVLLFTVLLVSTIELRQAMGLGADYVFGGAFVVGWVAQILGHSFIEHRRPALVDNVWQVFVAPIFVVAEWAFAMGMRPQLRADVAQRMQAYLPEAPAGPQAHQEGQV